MKNLRLQTSFHYSLFLALCHLVNFHHPEEYSLFLYNKLHKDSVTLLKALIYH